MPETPDWAAAPQSAVLIQVQATQVPQGGSLHSAGLASPGRRIIIVGLDVGTFDLTDDTVKLRGMAYVAIFDAVTSNILARATISPETPFATLRPPFGSVRSTAGGDVSYSNGIESGVGQALVASTLYYYLE